MSELPKIIDNYYKLDTKNKLHMIENHPISIIKSLVYSQFPKFHIYEDLHPIVSVEDNFDYLLIPKEHSSRRNSDSYYINENSLLRTHTSAHQNRLISTERSNFLVCGDVYRKDEVDRNHYPIFHQIEGVSLGDNAEARLKLDIEKLITFLFPNSDYRFINSYFPFTYPSFEVEVFYNNHWLEVLGCGKIHQDILKNTKIEGEGYAFGLGLERLAMVLFEIPDIRYFWSRDERFVSQFQTGKMTKFKEYSKYPPVNKDISLWIHDNFLYSNFESVIRDIAEDLIESIDLIDTFHKKDKISQTFRLHFRSLDRTLTDGEINTLYFKIRNLLQNNGYDLR